jgi:hypothetical protein
VTTPEIFDLLKRFRWNSFHSWFPLHNLFALLGGSLAEVSRRWIKRRNARLAQNWPPVDGIVLSIHVNAGTRFYGGARQYQAAFAYSYSVQEGSEIDHFSGDFSRPFPDEDRAWEWLQALKDKRIRVHVQPGKPEVSAVLAADLDAHFSLPARTPADFVLSPSATHPE